jgi:hypothetical protein
MTLYQFGLSYQFKENTDAIKSKQKIISFSLEISNQTVIIIVVFEASKQTNKIKSQSFSFQNRFVGTSRRKTPKSVEL